MSIIKERAQFFEIQAEQAKVAAEKDKTVAIAKVPFKHPNHIAPTWEHPTGNPDLVSITGFIPGPHGKAKPSWYRPPPKTKKDLPPASH